MCAALARGLVLVVAGCGAVPASPAPTHVAPVELFVSPDGSDGWSGRLPAPTGDRTDGPFATLERARDEVRHRRATSGLPVGGIAIELRRGRYERIAPFTLSAEDSGRADAPITYEAYRGESVEITGSRVVHGFRPVDDPAALARLDPSARGHVVQASLHDVGDVGSAGGGGLELFFAGTPMPLARWPNEGFARIAGVVAGDPIDVRGTTGDHSGKIAYAGDRPSRWLAEPDAWVQGYWFWDWSDSREPIASIDPARHVLALAPPFHTYGYRAGQWFYAYNLLSELDRPGEWYLDRSRGVLYFWPPSDRGDAEVSVASGALVVQNVSNVHFRGLAFEGVRGTAVAIARSSHVELAGCVVRNAGGWGVRITGGSASGVRDSEIAATGEGGIYLEGGDRSTLTPSGHYARGNRIHDFSRWKRTARAGIEMVGVGIDAANNSIHDAPNVAIAFSGNDHVIERNEIDHVCEESNDAAAIAAGRDWTMRGTVIRDNVLHDLSGFEGRGCNAIMLDDMFSGTTIRGNLFYRVARAILIGGGRDNVVDNNVFIDCMVGIRVDARGLGWAASSIDGDMRPRLAAVPYRSPPWAARYPELAAIDQDDPAAPKGNVVVRNISWRGRWDDLDSAAVPFLRMDHNLVDVDPRFVDPAHRNFQFRVDSPALALGIRPLSLGHVGPEARPRR